MFVLGYKLGLEIGELYVKETGYKGPLILTAREEMEARAIRVVVRMTPEGSSPDPNTGFYTGNAIYLTKGKILTNHHICDGMQKEKLIPNVEYLVQDKYGDEYPIESFTASPSKDLCILYASKIHLKYLPALKIMDPDANVTDILTGAAYSYANPINIVHGSPNRFFMFQERRAEVLERSTMNHNSIDYPKLGPNDPTFAEQFSGPIYKLSSLINYGDSGGAVYFLVNGRAELAGIIFAKEYAVPFPAQGYMVPASSVIQFLKKNSVDLGN